MRVVNKNLKNTYDHNYHPKNNNVNIYFSNHDYDVTT